MQYSKMHTNRHKPLAAAMLLACGSMACPLASAATIPVTNCNDSGNGSLRAAIAEAQNGDTVDMSVLTCSTITLTT